jgi:threonine dehydratase
VFVVSETSIAHALRFARETWGVVIEGSSAVALVPFLEGDPRADDAVIVLTGRNVD